MKGAEPDNNSIVHASLFSGIGGFDLAAEWMGWENAFHCEWNEFAQKILNYYWANAKSYGDITKTDFTVWRNRIDILTGGFPCQPYSLAGKRKGKEDNRHLWPEMLRAIQEIQPRYIVGENVYGIVNWNGGMVFNEVQSDLENEGYEVQPVILPACSKNAPHKRERVFFVAYSSNARTKSVRPKWQNSVYESGIITDTRLLGQTQRQKQPMGLKQLCEERNVANSKSKQGKWMQPEQQKISKSEQRKFGRINCKNGSERNDTYSAILGRIQNNIKLKTEKFKHVISSWDSFPTQSPICSRNDGVSSRLDGITFPKWRSESVKAYGNAIVPQVAYEIFKAIQITNNQ